MVTVFLMMIVACVIVSVKMEVRVSMGCMAVFVGMFMAVLAMNVEFDAINPGFFCTRNVNVETFQFQFLQLMFKCVWVDTKVKHRADKHVAAYAAENIKIKHFHLMTTRGAG
jgi:hypothetical protein